jgi:uncharacterized membrane protein
VSGALDQQRRGPTPSVSALIIVLVGFVLLVYRLGEQSLWGDEEYTTWVIQGSFSRLVSTMVAPGSAHPPLHFLCLWIWKAVAGDEELALRFPSVIFATLSTAMLYSLGRRMMGDRVALLATALMATSPFLVLYSRMARYYSLVLFCTLVSCWFWYKLVTSPGSARTWVGYVVASTLAIYTFYPACFLLVAQTALVVVIAWSDRRFVLRFLSSQAIIVLLFVPWVPVIFSQTAVLGDLPDAFAGSSPAAWLLSIMHPPFAWTVGETVYPWNPVALVAAILALYLAVRGVLSGRNTPGEGTSEGMAGATNEPDHPLSEKLALRSRWSPQVLSLTLFTLLPLLLTVVTVRQFVSGGSFMGVANRAIFCVPYLYLLIGQGLSTITRRPVRVLAVATLGAALGLSVANLYLGREYHNPIYSLQIEALADLIAEKAEPGEVFVSDHMTAFDYYMKRNHDAVAFRADDPESAMEYIEAHQSPGVWIILLSRAVDIESLARLELVPWLEERYVLERTFGYRPMEGVYSQVQQLVLGKPADEYKVFVYRYRRTGLESPD